jgi:hypothetical protein
MYILQPINLHSRIVYMFLLKFPKEFVSLSGNSSDSIDTSMSEGVVGEVTTAG